MPNQSALKEECIAFLRTGSKPRTITTSGLSMYPLIVEGSTLTFIPCSCGRSVALGDIVLFERAGALVAHRIVGRYCLDGCEWFREKGDNAFATGCFSSSALIGRIIKVEHNGHAHDLTSVRHRFAGRLLGIYWGTFFASLRFLSILKRAVFGSSFVFPCMRPCVLKVIRLLNRLPAGFFNKH